MMIEIEGLMSAIEKEEARRYHIKFMEYTWQYSTIPFLKGLHAEKICEEIDKAFEKLRNGKSTYLMIKVPFRHHKSQIVSRSLPPHFLGEFPEGEVIVASYSGDLSESFSRDAKNIIMSNEYQELYNTQINKQSSAISKWQTITVKDDKVLIGKTAWVGLGGSITGKGANLLIIDDFLKGRLEAESEKIRESIWQSFSNDLMTRRAEPSIVIILATPWHIDDLFGRIEKEMENNKDFPKFKEISFPAKSKKYKTGYLFPEKFSKNWYEGQYAILGRYAASALLDCNPKRREGNLIKVEEGRNWHYVDEKPEGFSRLVRGWDLASTKKELAKNDPDWTVGVKGAIKIEYNKKLNVELEGKQPLILSIYIEDIVRIRENAPKRNKIMLETALLDGADVIQYIESVAGYKDTYMTIREYLKGIAIVRDGTVPGDKLSRASYYIEMPFEFGNVFINRKINKQVLNEFLDTLKGFPDDAHDDDVDALVVMVANLVQNNNKYQRGII